DEHRTDLYVTKSSLDAVASPKETLDQWQKNAALYGENSRNTIDKLVDMLVVTALLPLGAVTGNATEDCWSQTLHLGRRGSVCW
ncbi:hypothetical protein, partial [Pseudomonas syringae]|uniref:hypothetical protein n=1 Tax=Pseudomonas syringae TaxID=317 RepID=UPI0019671E79